MIKKLRSLGAPLSKNEMRQLSGGKAPAGELWSCYRVGSTTAEQVCYPGTANPASGCGYASCTYVTLCGANGSCVAIID